MDLDAYQALWDQRADYYDVDYSDYSLDVDMFASFCTPTSVVCELGAGTLRMPRRLHGKYKTFDAVDISEKMLALGAKTLTPEQSAAINLIHVPMNEHHAPGKYDLVINLGNSFFMMTDDMKRETLSVIRSNLKPDGRFVLEYYNTNVHRSMPQNSLLHLRTIVDEDNGYDVTITHTVKVDESAREVRMIWFRDETDHQTRQMKRQTWPITFHFVDFIPLQEMLAEFFDVEAVYGGFEMQELDIEKSKHIICVARPRQA